MYDWLVVLAWILGPIVVIWIIIVAVVVIALFRLAKRIDTHKVRDPRW